MDVYKYANILCSYFTAVSKRCIKEEVDDSILDALICGLLVSFEKFHAENDYWHSKVCQIHDIFPTL